MTMDKYNSGLAANLAVKEAEIKALWHEVLDNESTLTDDTLTIGGRAEFDKFLAGKSGAGSNRTAESNIRAATITAIKAQIIEQLEHFIEIVEVEEDGVVYLEGSIRIKQ